MAALEYVHVPHYSALILRRTFADLALAGAIMDRARNWLAGTAAKWNQDTKSFTFPSGAKLTFGYLEHEADKYRYQGAEFQFVGFDELTQFTETQYLYLFSRTRKTLDLNIPLRIGAASNPGGDGHEWVYQRFFVEKRTFIPAKLSDNPSLDQESYKRQLNKLDAVTRAQLLEGDWTVMPKGPMFDRTWFEVIDKLPLDPHTNQPIQLRLARYWDFAATKPKPGKDPDWTVGLLIGMHDGVWYVLDIVRFRDKPMIVENNVMATAKQDGVSVEIGLEQEPGSSGVFMTDYWTRKLIGHIVRPDKKTGDKIELAKPFSSAAQAGHVKILRAPWNRDFLNELSAFPLVGHDDQVDAGSGAMRLLSNYATDDTMPERPSFSRRY